MCSPVIGQFFDATIVASSDNEWLNNDTSKSASWKVQETVMSHLKPTYRFHPCSKLKERRHELDIVQVGNLWNQLDKAKGELCQNKML